MFLHVDAYPGDPILTLNEDFQKDPRQDKINLSIGIYFDNEGRLPVMRAVREAESSLLAKIAPKPYLPMTGHVGYRQAVQELLFGANHEAVNSGRIATIQTLGGSGGLKVGGDFLKRYFPESQVWVSDPTWDNHHAMFEGAGFQVNTYPYYDPATKGLKFDAMLAAIDALPAQSIVLLHACHNQFADQGPVPGLVRDHQAMIDAFASRANAAVTFGVRARDADLTIDPDSIAQTDRGIEAVLIDNRRRETFALREVALHAFELFLPRVRSMQLLHVRP